MDDLERLQKKLIRRNEKDKPKKKKMDVIVMGIFIYWVSFVIVSFITFWIKGSVPDTLIQYGLGGGAIELFLAAWIENNRDKKKEDDA
jgi:hypothetical protein